MNQFLGNIAHIIRIVSWLQGRSRKCQRSPCTVEQVTQVKSGNWIVHILLCITAWKESGRLIIHNLGTQHQGSPWLSCAQLVSHCGISRFSRQAVCDTHVAVRGCGRYITVHDTNGRRLIGWRMRWPEEAVTVILEPSDYWEWAIRGRKPTTTNLSEGRTSYVIDALQKKRNMYIRRIKKIIS